MDDETKAMVPVWTLAARDMPVPPIAGSEVMTLERLNELRTALATFADSPIATLEAHPLPDGFDRSEGLPLDAASPLAQHLSELISQTSNIAPDASIGAVGEMLYRMVVPAKVAAQVGGGMVKPKASKAATPGIYSDPAGSSGSAGQSAFIAIAGNVAATGMGTLTLAAPLVMMAIAVGISAYADHRRQESSRLLNTLRDDALARERSELNGCRTAIDNATAVLLDKGHIGHALGLAPAVNTINVAVAAARERLAKWQRALDSFGEKPVELAKLLKHFDGVDRYDRGEFRPYLELADMAIELNKRVIVLQAVEEAQLDPGNPLESFMKALKRNQKSVTELETGIADVLRRLSTLRLDRSHGLADVVFTPGEVDDLLRAGQRLRELGDGIESADHASDVAIEMVRETDGSVVVLPAYRTPIA